jgi:WD40 repeat protein
MSAYYLIDINKTYIKITEFLILYLNILRQAFIIDNAHGQLVRDIDFNPNKQYYIASCGDDCKTKFWDIRKTNECLKSLSSHSHW